MRRDAEHTSPCSKCEHWKLLSGYNDKGFACHCLLDTGVRNGLRGNKCSTYSPRKGTRHDQSDH